MANTRHLLRHSDVMTSLALAYLSLIVGLLALGFAAGWHFHSVQKRIDAGLRLRKILDAYAEAWKPEPPPQPCCRHVALLRCHPNGVVTPELAEVRYDAEEQWDNRRVVRGGSA